MKGEFDPRPGEAKVLEVFADLVVDRRVVDGVTETDLLEVYGSVVVAAALLEPGAVGGAAFMGTVGQQADRSNFGAWGRAVEIGPSPEADAPWGSLMVGVAGPRN